MCYFWPQNAPEVRFGRARHAGVTALSLIKRERSRKEETKKMKGNGEGKGKVSGKENKKKDRRLNCLPCRNPAYVMARPSKYIMDKMVLVDDILGSFGSETRQRQLRASLLAVSMTRSRKNSKNSMKVMMAKPNHRPRTPPESEMYCSSWQQHTIALHKQYWNCKGFSIVFCCISLPTVVLRNRIAKFEQQFNLRAELVKALVWVAGCFHQ